MSDLAGLIGRPADGLYFHLRVLEKCGLVRWKNGDRGEGRAGSVVELTVVPVRLTYSDDARARAQNARIVAAAIRMSMREFEAACGETSVPADGPGRQLWGGRSKGWLTAAEIARLVEHIEGATQILRAGMPRKGTVPVALGFLVSPCGVASRAQGAKKASKGTKGSRS